MQAFGQLPCVAGSKTGAVQVGDRIIFANGHARPRVTNGSYWSLAGLQPYVYMIPKNLIATNKIVSKAAGSAAGTTVITYDPTAVGSSGRLHYRGESVYVDKTSKYNGRYQVKAATATAPYTITIDRTFDAGDAGAVGTLTYSQYGWSTGAGSMSGRYRIFMQWVSGLRGVLPNLNRPSNWIPGDTPYDPIEGDPELNFNKITINCYGMTGPMGVGMGSGDYEIDRLRFWLMTEAGICKQVPVEWNGALWQEVLLSSVLAVGADPNVSINLSSADFDAIPASRTVEVMGDAGTSISIGKDPIPTCKFQAFGYNRWWGMGQEDFSSSLYKLNIWSWDDCTRVANRKAGAPEQGHGYAVSYLGDEPTKRAWCEMVLAMNNVVYAGSGTTRPGIYRLWRSDKDGKPLDYAYVDSSNTSLIIVLNGRVVARFWNNGSIQLAGTFDKLDRRALEPMYGNMTLVNGEVIFSTGGAGVFATYPVFAVTAAGDIVFGNYFQGNPYTVALSANATAVSSTLGLPATPINYPYTATPPLYDNIDICPRMVSGAYSVITRVVSTSMITGTFYYGSVTENVNFDAPEIDSGIIYKSLIVNGKMVGSVHDWLGGNAWFLAEDTETRLGIPPGAWQLKGLPYLFYSNFGEYECGHYLHALRARGQGSFFWNEFAPGEGLTPTGLTMGPAGLEVLFAEKEFVLETADTAEIIASYRITPRESRTATFAPRSVARDRNKNRLSVTSKPLGIAVTGLAGTEMLTDATGNRGLLETGVKADSVKESVGAFASGRDGDRYVVAGLTRTLGKGKNGWRQHAVMAHFDAAGQAHVLKLDLMAIGALTAITDRDGKDVFVYGDLNGTLGTLLQTATDNGYAQAWRVRFYVAPAELRVATLTALRLFGQWAGTVQFTVACRIWPVSGKMRMEEMLVEAPGTTEALVTFNEDDLADEYGMKAIGALTAAGFVVELSGKQSFPIWLKGLEMEFSGNDEG